MSKNLSYLPLLVLMLFISSFNAKAQQVSGTVKDVVTKSPVSNASVQIKNSKKGITTDENGHFTIEAKAGDVLQITSVGFEASTFIVKASATDVEILLKATAGALSDVIVVGQQRQSRRTSTVAMSSLSGKAMENLPAPSLDILLQGRVTGVNIQVNSGEPGVAPIVVVRGNSAVSQNLDGARALSGPLYVIDGVPVNPQDISSNTGGITGSNYLAGINVNDIESIDVQKDASATAAWGSRGANGVIYIKTKRGRSLTPEFRIGFYGGATLQPKLLPTVTGAEERQQKLDLLHVYGNYANLASVPQILTDSLNPYFNNATDWQGLFYRNGSIKNADMSVSAAGENFNYRLSMNYYDEQGVLKATGYQRYSLRGNFGFNLTKNLTAQLNIGLTQSDRQRGKKLNNTDDNTPFVGSGIPSSLIKITAFDSSNYLGLSNNIRNKNKENYNTASLQLNYTPLRGLQLSTQGSAVQNISQADVFTPSNIDANAANNGNFQPSYAYANETNYVQYNWINNISYSRTFNDKHAINLLVSQQFERDIVKGIYTSEGDGPSNDIQVVTGSNPQTLNGSSSYAASARLSLLAQAGYTFNGKYSINATYRGDQSSRFGANYKWGYFPSVSAGWIVSDEKFMKPVTAISYFKIRGSYGVSGEESDYFYAPYNSYVLSSTYGGQVGVVPSYTNGIAKNDLTWVNTYQGNIGFEAQFLKSRISLTADYYSRLTKDGYFTFTLPFYTGYASINTNAKDLWISNRGVEVQLITHNLSPRSKLDWTTTVNVSFNKNLIARLPNGNRSFTYDDFTGTRIFTVGQPIYEMYQMQYTGIYNDPNRIPVNPLTGAPITYFSGNHTVQPGDPAWTDRDNDYDVWDGSDNKPSGDPNPKYTGGLVNDFRYKNFTLSVLCTYTFKRDVINTFMMNQFQNIYYNDKGYSTLANSLANSRLPDLSGMNYWRPDQAAKDPASYEASFPSLSPYNGYFYQFFPFSTMFNESGNYFKIRTVTLGYSLPQKLTDRLKLKETRLYGTVDNVYTFTKSTMPDPEAVDAFGVYTGGLYPVPRKVTIGVTVNF